MLPAWIAASFSENASDYADLGFIPVDGVGAGGGIRTHVAQRTTGFQVLFQA